jgi:hypothetical protein
MREELIHRINKTLLRVVLHFIRMELYQPTQDRVFLITYSFPFKKSNVQDMRFSEIKSTQLSGDLTTYVGNPL